MFFTAYAFRKVKIFSICLFIFWHRAEKELGIKLRVTSGFRTWAEQDELPVFQRVFVY